MILLVQIGQLLKFILGFFRILHQSGVNQVTHLFTFIDIKSPEALAAVKFCINDIPFHNSVFYNSNVLQQRWLFVYKVFYCRTDKDVVSPGLLTLFPERIIEIQS